MTFRFKLLVLVGSVALFAATGVTAVALWRDVVQSQRLLAAEGAVVAAGIAASSAASPEPLLRRALGTLPIVRAAIVDLDGRVVSCADATGAGCPAGPPSALSPPDGPLDVLRRLVRREPLEASAPIVREGKLAGAVRLAFLGSPGTELEFAL